MKKKKYDTSVVMLYLIGKEHLLPKEFRKQIPYSTIASWRRIDYSSYIGQEYRIFFEDHTDYLELKKTSKEQSRALRSIAKAWLLMREELLPILQKAKTDAEMQRKVVLVVDYLRSGLGLRVLKQFGNRLKGYDVSKILNWNNCYYSYKHTASLK